MGGKKVCSYILITDTVVNQIRSQTNVKLQSVIAPNATEVKYVILSGYCRHGGQELSP